MVNVLALFNVTNVELPGVTGLTEKLMLVPAGTPAMAVNVMGVLNPPKDVVDKFAAMIDGDGQLAEAVAPDVNVNPEGGTHPKELFKLVLNPPAANTAFILTDWPIVNIFIQASFV